MARLYVRPGVNPDDPHVPVAVLVVDPDGTPGERAVARLGGCCYEGDGVVYLVQTDGWAERALAGGQLVVDIAVYPAVLQQVGVDPAGFPGRSAVDPQAVVVLHEETAVDPALSAGLAEATVVLTAGPDVPLDELLAFEDDWPMVVAPVRPRNGPGRGGDEPSARQESRSAVR
ncbi:hypothetical protein AB0C02_24095 [Micromonospora sp. NPDC048999]|uniref:hypothetical protein n=1 Tax=Micromonospora sp. NPDC048999 TaxID=3155391 RepID=UPI0033C56B43